MASTIKGIIVSIGGDTTNLKKSLDSVDKTSKDLQRELNLVNRELKFNPDSATLLAQKQEILAEKVNATREKLNKLNEVQEQVERQAKSGDLGAEEYRAYQREVEKTKSQLGYLENELGKTGEKFNEVQRRSGNVNFKNAEDKVDHLKGKFKDFAEDASKNLDAFSKKAEKIGDGLDKAGGVLNKASAGGAAILAGSVASFKDLDNGYDIIVKKTGATGEAFDKLKATADDLFSNNSFDMQAIGSAIGEIYTRFGYTNEQLKAVSETYLQFAKINDTDVSNSVAKSSQIVQAWNLSAEQIPDLLGLITGKAQETGISAEGLMDKVLQNNASFKEMGLSLEESVSLMAQFEKNGVNDSTALAALKAAVKNATKEGKSLSEALKDNVADIKNAKTDTEALQVATKLFGAKGAAEMAHAIREGRINFDNLSTSMGDYKDTVKKTYEGTLDPLEKSKKGLNNLKLAGAELANVALKEGEPLIEDVIEGIKGVTEWIKKLNPEQKQMLIKAIEIVAVAGPAVKITSGIAKGISSIASLASSLIPKLVGATGAQMGLNAAMDANPVGAVVLALTALVAAVLGFTKAVGDAHKQHLEDLGFTDQIERMEEAVDRVKDIRDEVSGLKDDINNTMSSTTADMTLIDDYKNKFDELIEKVNLTPAEQAELVTIGEYFKEKYPEFEKAWDKYISVDNNGKVTITGNIKDIKSELDSLIDKYKKIAASNALADMATQNSKASVTSRQNLTKTAKELQDAKKELQDWRDEWNLTDENLKKLLDSPHHYTWQNKDATKNATVGDLVNQYNKLTEAIGKIEQSYNEIAKSVYVFNDNVNDISRMQAVLNGNYDDAVAVLMAYNAGLITTSDIEKSRWKSLENLSEAAKKVAMETGENIIFGMATATEKELNRIKQEGTKTVDTYVKAVDDAVKVKEAEGGLNSFFNLVNNALAKIPFFAEKTGTNISKGLAKGMTADEATNRIKGAVQTVFNKINTLFNGMFQIKSPSRVMRKTGVFIGQGLALGIEDTAATVEKSSNKLSDIVKGSFSAGTFDFGRIKNTYASIGKLRSSGIAETQSRINNISNSTSKNINGGVNVTINQAKLDTDADVERMGEKLADIIIRKGMEWG